MRKLEKYCHHVTHNRVSSRYEITTPNKTFTLTQRHILFILKEILTNIRNKRRLFLIFRK